MPQKWSLGYSSDVTYILGFYRELAPSFLHYACAINGVAGVPWSRRLRYCELGCGRGLGTTLLAAANPDVTFVGIDFSPTHIAEARAFAGPLDLQNLSFREMSFGEASRSSDSDLSEFDIVAMHGVYSWVTSAVREDIHEFIRSKLVPAGICFASYNTMPGWASVGPVQRLLQEVGKRSQGDSLSQFSKGYETLRALVEKSSAFVVQNPILKDRIAKMEKQDKRYLAHEFLNSGWEPLYVTDVMASLSEAKLSYVGSASIAENRQGLCVPKNLQQVVRDAPDLAMRELLRDYAVNKQFRRDIYVKGPLALSAQERMRQLDEIKFARVHRSNDLPKTLPVPAGQATPDPDLLQRVITRLEEGPATAPDLAIASKRNGSGSARIYQLLEILVHNNLIHPLRANYEANDFQPSHRLNKAIFALAATGNTHHYLASPVLGSAIACNYFDRLVAREILNDADSSDEQIAQEIIATLSGAGLNVQKDGQIVDDPVGMVAHHANEFRAGRLAEWRSLGLMP